MKSTNSQTVKHSKALQSTNHLLPFPRRGVNCISTKLATDNCMINHSFWKLIDSFSFNELEYKLVLKIHVWKCNSYMFASILPLGLSSVTNEGRPMDSESWTFVHSPLNVMHFFKVILHRSLHFFLVRNWRT